MHILYICILHDYELPRKDNSEIAKKKSKSFYPEPRHMPNSKKNLSLKDVSNSLLSELIVKKQIYTLTIFTNLS